jgi:hypothetical protein
VWIVDSPPNRAAAEKFWITNPGRTHLNGITVFKFDTDSSPEEILLNELDTIDLHHGAYSTNFPYAMEVIGSSLSEALRERLLEFGFAGFEATLEGFRAVRSSES